MIAWIITKLITSPVVLLTKKIAEVQSNSDFSIRMQLNCQDEIGQAADAFDRFMNETEMVFNNINETMASFAQGQLDARVDNHQKGDLKKLNNATNALMQQMAENALQAEDNVRVKQALDACNTSVLMTDVDFNIIYTNQSLQLMMSEAEAEIKKAIPSFNAKQLLDSNIDQFYENPSHQRGILNNLDRTFENMIKIGPLDMMVTTTPIFTDENEKIGFAVEWKNLTDELAARRKEKQLAAENARIKQALDNVSTNAMIADNERNIVYLNKSVSKMLKSREAALKEVLPNFDADHLHGAKIDVFHKNPAHQAQLLDTLNSTYQTEIKVNGLTFSLIANPVFDDEGIRIGAVVEWNDRTEEVAVEHEIDALVDNAANGDLTARINMQHKDGFFEKLGLGLNRLLGISEGVINDTARVLDALAHGDLNEKIEQDYQGSFGKLKRERMQQLIN